MLLHELAKLINDRQCVHVAFALALCPGTQAVTAKHNSIASGVLVYCCTQHHRQLEAGSLPRDPNQSVVKSPVEFLHLRFSVCGRRQRDSPIGMKVIHMSEGQKSV